jgi:hypothetical protein
MRIFMIQTARQFFFILILKIIPIMALIWGKIAKPVRRTTTNYPDTVEQVIITTEPYEGKGFNRKFSFNLHAQKFLDLRKQESPEVVKNDHVIYSYNEETGDVYFGIYDKEAFAEIEKVAEINKIEIGKTTMGFASKELYGYLQKKFDFNDQEANYFELVPVVLEAPVQLYSFVQTWPNSTNQSVTAIEEIEETDEEVPALTNAGEEADVSLH